MTDLSFYYKVKDYNLFFTFSYESSLISISCHDTKITSRKGLVVGDSIKTDKNLYGTDYMDNLEGVSVIQYKVADGYFNVFYENGTVTSWQLSAYPNINND